jgi:anti-anti-sigma factor
MNTVKTENLSGDVIAFELQREPQMNGELQAVIDIAAEQSDCNIILDLNRVDIISSSSLTKLLKLRQTLLSSNRRLVLCNIPAFAKSTLEITGLQGFFELATDGEAAMVSIRSI